MNTSMNYFSLRKNKAYMFCFYCVFYIIIQSIVLASSVSKNVIKKESKMDDGCAVCAGNLDWVAYGACGHRDVCSTCIIRLRFICNDRRCCICKTESDVIFVTKALGEYTSRIKDFSVLPHEVKEGRAGSYWYHEATQAFFDDDDHYKMVKAMCRLSCNECDKMEHQFTNIEQLRGHLNRRHKLVMCSLCLEGRKAFIREQKLYTRQQLNQHMNSGDSEVDRTECERGGFMGHPKCGFCKSSFYGKSELYSHMSREHYTCHICQRQHPGQCKYYKNYDDLENHFRRDHYQCEDEACLAKKFMVFPSIMELKKHNDSEHGGRMSRPQRNVALQAVSAHGNTNVIDPLVQPTHSSENNTNEALEWRRKKKNKRSFSSAQAWPETSRRPMEGSSSSSHVINAIYIAATASLVTRNEVAQMSYASSSQAQAQAQPITSYISIEAGSLVISGHSESEPSASNSPPASMAKRHKHSSSSRVLRIVEEVQTTNKSLVENMMN